MKTVIITHGLLMKSPVMSYISNYFQRKGYNIKLFNYRTTFFDKEQTMRDLELLCKNEKDIYFIGHSMGGLILREFIQSFPSDNYKSFVTLGTPHNRSRLAEIISKTELNFLLGINHESGLISNLKEYVGKPPLGSIAGNKPKGFLSIYNKLFKKNLNLGDNDGTVLVSETQEVNCKDHIVLNVSHSGMLFSLEVVEQIEYFFNNNIFFKNDHDFQK